MLLGSRYCTHNNHDSRKGSRSGLHNLFTIAGRITFIFKNYGRQRIQEEFIFLRLFCSASTRLLGRLSSEYSHTVDKEILRPP